MGIDAAAEVACATEDLAVQQRVAAQQQPQQAAGDAQTPLC